MLAMLHLGQAILEPAETVQSGGDFNFTGRRAWKVEVPPTLSSSLEGSSVQAGPPTQLYTMFGIKSTKHLNKYIHSLRIY